MFARLSGDELGENVPKIRIIIQDALREVKDGTADAASRAKKIRRQLKAIRVALTKSYGNISKAAEMLGITRPTLYDLLNKYGLSAEGYSKKAAS